MPNEMRVPRLSLVAISLLLYHQIAPTATQDTEELKTINYKAPDGSEHVELAFRAPMAGLPQHALDVFCANTKMRLYWGVFREEIKETHRKGFHLRHAARMAKHVFSDVRDVDKPFNATMLSQIDKWFPAKFDNNNQDGDKEAAAADSDEKDEPSGEHSHSDSASSSATSVGGKIAAASKKKLSSLKSKLTRQKSDCSHDDGKGKGCKKSTTEKANSDGDNNNNNNNNNSEPGEQEQLDLLDSSDQQQQQIDGVDASKFTEIKKQLKSFLKKWSPKVAMSIYTRWRTLWWLMMSCLFTKYYLWDPALDEFTKLKRNLVMWPELQVAKLKHLQCKPVQLFKRILDVCKILNPLLNINFGVLSLDKPTRFKGDTS